MSVPMTAARLLDVTAERICIIKPSALGDVVQSLPLLPGLRGRFPGATISWVINRELSGLLEGHPHLDALIPFDRRGSWRDWTRLLGELRGGRFDLVLDLQGLMRTGLMTLATAAPLRIGLETAREGARLACNYVIPESDRSVPAHLRYARAATALGCDPAASETRVALAPSDHAWVQQRLAGLHRPLLVVHPGARWETKCWPVENFAVVACRAVRQFGFSVAIVGSRSESQLAGQLAELLHRFAPAAAVLNLAGESNLKQLACLLQEADLVLSNDSGPMHLAAGLGSSVVSVFTCTSPVRSGPPGTRHALVATEVPCAGSYRKTCPHSGPEHMACMQELSVERVWSALAALVERLSDRARSA